MKWKESPLCARRGEYLLIIITEDQTSSPHSHLITERPSQISHKIFPLSQS